MKFTPEHLDLLSEYINVGMGRAASILNDMLGCPISLDIPKVSILSSGDATEHLENMGTGNFVSVSMRFTGNFEGTVGLMFSSASAATLLKLLNLGDEAETEADLDAMRSGALTEIGNILLNSVMGNIVNLMKAHLVFDLPSYSENDARTVIEQISGAGTQNSVELIVAKTSFLIESQALEGCVVIVFDMSVMPKLGEALDAILGAV
jgi:chemotaxis protein CheC